MILDLIREDLTATHTFGILLIDGRFCCFTLEDPVRTGPKIAHETAIPYGTYPVTITRSVRFARLMPLVEDVPGFTGIRIHAGNTTADTSGCILLGLARTDAALLSSRAALELVQHRLADALAHGERVTLTISTQPRAPGVPA